MTEPPCIHHPSLRSTFFPASRFHQICCQRLDHSLFRRQLSSCPAQELHWRTKILLPCSSRLIQVYNRIRINSRQGSGKGVKTLHYMALEIRIFYLFI
ncbi:hypothetical protein HYC85_013535 [Camellia sinensis]|uniref:Uncharacterized protein n=1 Tax=Camellia sinensis TaxID=4442 RepID=A0A7J7H771_CAMSI|nr:hypothetical protein HYC85_013535 [Camellia sinensis]